MLKGSPPATNSSSSCGSPRSSVTSTGCAGPASIPADPARPRVVVIAGAAGGVGEAIVRALLQGGDERIVVTARSDERHALLRERLAPAARHRVIPVVGDVSSAGNARGLAARVREAAGEFDVAIPSLGGWWEGEPLLGVEQSTWEAVMREMLETHVFFAQAFLPDIVRGGGTYLGIGGGAALTPIAGAGLVSIAAAAQVMMTRVLAAENAGADIRELVVNGPVRTRDSAPFAGPDWIEADDIGTVVADLLRTGTTAWPAMRGRPPILIMDRRP